MEDDNEFIWHDMWHNTNGIIEKIAVAAGAVTSFATAIILKLLVWVILPCYIVLRIVQVATN